MREEFLQFVLQWLFTEFGATLDDVLEAYEREHGLLPSERAELLQELGPGEEDEEDA